VVSITLLSTLALVAVPMLRMPMTAYMESAARVNVSTELDTVQTRLNADLARAVPNSIRLRTVGARQLLEFLEVRAEGRHRNGASGAAQSCPAVCASVGNNDSLEAACSERCFTSLGPALGDVPVPGADYVVVNPLGPGVPNGDPYFGGAAAVAGGIKSRLNATAALPGGTRFDIAPHSFPALATTRRFYIVAGPVSYECNPATQRLVRYDGYAIGALQPVGFAGAQSAVLASGISACSFVYTRTSGRGGMLSLWLRFTRPVSAGAPSEFSELVLSAPVNEG
jgi:MSHA biogenesis protein MshO